MTGIVQEFQFGMNWSDYSRFVGDIFGAPLAIEGLLAFFLESTFLGLWIFGWDRLSRRVHLATIWIAAIGTVLSAYFILAANSWMQYPVGYTFNEGAGRAELNDIVAVLTSKVALVTFAHTIPAAFMTGGAFIAGIAMWRLLRHPDTDRPAYRTAAKVGAWMLVVSGLLVTVTGDLQARIMTEVQPMKMASAEALWDTSRRPRSPSSRLARSTGRRRSSPSGSRTSSRSWQPATRTARWKGSTTSRPGTSSNTGRATGRRTSRSRTGRSAS